MTLNTILAAVMMMATVADILTTEYGIKRGSAESNPVAKFLMARLGRWWYAPKLLAAGVILYAPESAPWWLIAGVTALLAGVAALNLRTISRIEK